MDFIERWLNISPDGGSGLSEVLILVVITLTVLSVIGISLRKHLPRSIKEYLEQRGNRESGDRFDN